LEQAFHRSGAFGRFQFASSAVNTIVNGACMFFFNSFTFLEVEPQVMCYYDNPLDPTKPDIKYSDSENDLMGKDYYCKPDQTNCVINYDSKETVYNLIT